MLQQLLDIFEENPGGFDQDRLCQALGITPAGLQPLLDVLVRKGRLTMFSPGEDSCTASCQACPALLRCQADQVFSGTLYRVKS